MSSSMVYLSRSQRERAANPATCSVDACGNVTDTRGMCSKHYRRWLRHGSTDLARQPRDLCNIDGCGRKHEARGLCQSHYKRWQRHQDPMVRLIKGCAAPGCLARVAVGRYCESHAERSLVGRRTANPLRAAYRERVTSS